MIIINKCTQMVIKMFFFLNIFMLFYTVLPKIISILICTIIVLYSYHVLKKVFTRFETLFIISILTIPFSFVSIFSTAYGTLPITWHNLLIIILFFISIVNSKFSPTYILLLLLFITFSFLSLFLVDDIVDSLKQILTIILFYFSFIIGDCLKVKSKNIDIQLLQHIYISICYSYAVQILVQKVYIQITSNIIGHYRVMGAGRYAYAGLMGDFSFATLFLASGCLLIFLQFVDSKELNYRNFIIGELLLLIAILVVSSRTGLVALVFTVLGYILHKYRRINYRLLIVIFLAIILLPIVVSILINLRGGQSLFDSSGRLNTYRKSFEIFSDNVLFGIGFGENNLYLTESIALPHNFFIQYLVQSGLLGLFIILSFFIVFLKKNFFYCNYFKWLFVLVSVGAMFIPDIVSSRFFYAIITIMMISSNQCQTKEVLNKWKKRFL